MTNRRSAGPAILETTLEMLSRANDAGRSYRSVFEDSAGHASRFVRAAEEKSGQEKFTEEARERGSRADATPEPEQYGITPDNLYTFAQGEIQQWERLFRLGFRYAESMLDMSRRRYDDYTREPTLADLTAVRRDDVARVGPMRILNETNAKISLTFLLSELTGHPSGKIVPAAAKFDCAKRDLVADEETTATLTVKFLEPDTDASYTGEIEIRGGTLNLKQRIVIKAEPAPSVDPEEVMERGDSPEAGADVEATRKKREQAQPPEQRQSSTKKD